MSSKTYLLKRITQAALIAIVGGFLSTTPANAVAYEATVSGSCVYRNNPAGTGLGGFISISYTKQNAAGTNPGQIAFSEYTYENDVANYGANTKSALSGVLKSTIALDSNTSTIVLPIADTYTTYAKSVTYQVWLSPAGTVGTTPGSEAAVAYVKCNAAGAPASYSLSATTASANQGETATFTVTPKDAAGNTTILASTNETMTVEVSATAGTANLQAGKLRGSSGVLAGQAALGASIASLGTTAHTQANSGLISQAGVMPSTTGTTTKGSIALSSVHADALPTRNTTATGPP